MTDTMATEPDMRARSAENRRKLEQFLLAAIADGTFEDGRLPPERDLAERFNIPRYTVRKAIAGVSDRVPVMRRSGRGTYLAAAQPPGTSPLNYSPAEIIQARLAIEPGMADFVVVSATREDFDEMERCLAGAAKVNDGREFKSWIYRLHLAIATATHNKLLGHVFQLIKAAREAEGMNLLPGSVCGTAEGRKRYLAENRQIVKALRDRNATLASQLLYRHLVGIHASLINRLPKSGAATAKSAARG